MSSARISSSEEREGEEEKGGLDQGGWAEEEAVALPGDVEGEAVDVSLPALSAQHHDGVGLLVRGVGVAGVLGPGRHVSDEEAGVVTGPLSDTLVPADLPHSVVTGGPGEVPVVVLATPRLDTVLQQALLPPLLGRPPPLRLPPGLDGQAEVRLLDADTEEAVERTGGVRTSWKHSVTDLAPLYPAPTH